MFSSRFRTLSMGDFNSNAALEGTEKFSAFDGKTEVTTTGQAEVKLTDYIRESLEKVAVSEGFKNYEFKADQSSTVGDGSIGLIYKATILEIDSDKKLDVVVKFPPVSQERRNDFGAMELFEREVYVYNEVFPELMKFQQEKKIEESIGFCNFPKCYFAEFNEEKDDSIIIMEDLREDGFKMLNKYVPADFEHTKILVAALGRLHAVSFALKAQKPELFEKYRLMKDFVFEKYREANLTGMMIGCIEKAAETVDENDSESRNKVLRLKTEYSQVTKEVVDPELAEPYAVIGQGDCWPNNLMYQYKNGSVHKIVLLDWQNFRYCSPVLDLANFIFGCADGDLRANHYDELLNIYHQTLRELLDSLGGDTDSQFPFTALLDQFKQFGKYGIIMGSMIIPANSKGEDVPDSDSIANSAQALLQRSSHRSESIKARIRDAVMDAIHLGYL